ncbi:hypothetical protein [Agromyces sp. NPDC058064]|uniref:hypothetical protein n=1 Tax=Agromyces sp. NPDC058064 TaxID=3346322 RepID=UPI0036DCCB32
MDALEYARIVQAHVLERDPDAVERVLVGEAPAYAARLAEIADAVDRDARLVKPRLLDELRTSSSEVSQDAARTLAPMRGRTVAGMLVAVLAEAGAFAFFFSRADLDPGAVLPAAMVLLAVAAAGLAFAVLPVRVTAPPSAGVAFTGWVLAVLGGMTMLPTVRFTTTVDASAAGWLWLGGAATTVTLAIAISCAIARRRLPRARESEALVAGFPDRVRGGLLALRARAAEEAASAYAALDPDQRASLERGQRAARAELERRGIRLPAAPAPPGCGIAAAGVAAAAIMANVELDPA